MSDLNLSSHVCSAEPAAAFGWLVGFVHEGDCLPLSAIRCLDGLSSDFDAEAAELEALLPGGVCVLGFFVSCAADAAETALIEVARSHTAALTKLIAPDALATDAGLLFAAASRGESPAFFRGKLSASSLSPLELPALSELQERVRSHFVGLRCSLRLPLQVETGGRLDATLAAALESSEESSKESPLRRLRSDGLCFVFGEARHLGVVCASETVHACAALTDPHEAAAEDEDEEEGEEEGEGGGGEARPRTVRGGKKGKGKKVTAPVLALEEGTAPTVTDLPIALDALVYARRETPLSDALSALRRSLLSQYERLTAALAAAALSSGSAMGLRPRGCWVHPPQLALPLCAHYILRADDDPTEESAREQRERLHLRYALPLDRPLVRASLALGSGGDDGTYGGIPGLIRNAHEGLPPSGVKKGKVSLVQGAYDYYHYLQWTGHQRAGRYDDNGWGCAYRSLQSIVSWFRIQRYTNVRNPTHYEIQKHLVEHCAQNREQLLGKKMWLGSTDLSLYLDSRLGVACKQQSYPSGDDISADARRIAHHFDTHGTPVMIGGGELAFTLLGVDFDEDSGECRFLIMDPHYTGADDISQIHPKWVGWKTPSSPTHLGTKLFQKETFYNLLFPQRPSTI